MAAQSGYIDVAMNSFWRTLLIGSVAITAVTGIRITTPSENMTAVPAWSAVPVLAPLSRFDAAEQSRRGGSGMLRAGAPGWEMKAASQGGSTGGTALSARQMRALEMSLAGHNLRKRRSRAGVLASASDDSDLSARVIWLKDMFGTEYSGVMGVGTARGPAGELTSETELRVIFDTGSADLWVASDLCTDWPCNREGLRRYNHSRSSTYHPTASLMQVQTEYGSGKLEGQLGVDNVRVGPFVARNQVMGLVEKESGSAFEQLPMDGLVGLGFPDLVSSDEAKPGIMENLMMQSSLPLKIFAFYLHRDPKNGGLMLWGGVDSRLYKDSLVWFPVVEQDYWTLELVSLRVGDKAMDFPPVRNLSFSTIGGSSLRRKNSGQQGATPRWSIPPKLIVDSGTTLFMIPQSWTDELLKHKGQNINAMPCSRIGQLPKVVFTLTDATGAPHDLVVPPEVYMVRTFFNHMQCLPGFVASPDLIGDERPMVIIGEIFMRHFFTVFSRGDTNSSNPNPRGSGGPPSVPAVGFAPARHGGEADAFLAQAMHPEEKVLAKI
mmetsp:Transcript_45971/g.76339  ORF Transcript_45971/g.76339 Transcript_45971/m.76339 type:complete len:549 (+) Transcript_45971:10-1656(+)